MPGRGTRLAKELAASLSGALEALCGPGAGEVGSLRRLPGGSSRETWSFEGSLPGRGRRRLVLRRDPPGASGSGMARELRLLRAASAAGVPVPAVVTASDDPSLLGSPFVVMEHVEGETIPRRILRQPELSGARAELTSQCGRALAAVHRMPVDALGGPKAGDEVVRYRELLWELGEPHPAFEVAFRWLEANRPPAEGPTVVHGDFRNGNLIVGPEGLRAVLDWELAHLGDPVEDLGWLCVKAWRFGSPLPVGGFGEYRELLDAYEEASGRPVELGALRWWELFGTLRWGIICIVQAMTHLGGAVRSVELATIGRRVCEVEWDVLDLLDELS